MKSRGLVLVVALGSSLVGADCDGNIAKDPTFRDWCGASLCAWKTDFGKIDRVPTWNAEDFGVSFGDGANGSEISQVTEESEAKCILFTSVGDIDPGAQMTIGVDFDSDGSIDVTAPLGAATWHQVQSEITAPPKYRGITFYVTKHGTGTAILAEMTIKETTGCAASSAPKLGRLRMGEACETTADCADGLVCPVLHQCSQCGDATSCADGARCDQWSVFMPLQCAPGQGLGESGAPCLVASDCASGACMGATPVNLQTGDAGSCNLDALGSSDPANCSWFAAYGGTCR